MDAKDTKPIVAVEIASAAVLICTRFAEAFVLVKVAEIAAHTLIRMFFDRQE